jgi:hypothetical protein
MGELSTVQLIFIGVGVAIALPSLLELFKNFSVPSFKTSKKEVKLSSTVVQWESLYGSCKQLCLQEACKKLDELFPLLVERDQDCLEKGDEIEILDD